MGKPSRASFEAGLTRSAQGVCPILMGQPRPRTVPGTPAARGPARWPGRGLPSGPRYIRSVAAFGAISRKSTVTTSRESAR